ncbi:hypothetical protein [Puia dinghuensis]|nr:hypothetical protein [Puia dinghuensis]
MKKAKLLNPERKPLSIEKLRELTGWHDLSDEQAANILISIRLFVKILYEAAKKNDYCIDNQIDVSLKDNSEPLNNAA